LIHQERESMAPQPPLDLLADIGGTHARLALSAGPGHELANTAVVECRSYSGLQELVHEYLRAQGHPRVRRAALAVATAITGDQVALTNNSWTFSQRAVQSEFEWDQLLVLNDFTALALSLPSIGPSDRLALGDGIAEPGGPVALIGAGTGLGMSGLLPDGHGGWVPIAGEGGHGTIAPNDSLEVAVVANLQRYFGHISTERVLSGQGLVNLYNAMCDIHGLHASVLQPEDVVRMGLAQEDAACNQALDCFCAFLGSAAGNWALALGARGGVYIGGGIAPRLSARLLNGRFRAAFESKGRLSDYLRRVPTWVLHDQPQNALRGAAHALSQAR
jgi:glucokinase